MLNKSVFSTYVLFVFIGLFNMQVFAEELNVLISDDIEITIEKTPAKGDFLILWLAPEYGFREAHSVLAKQLSDSNIEVWQGDIVESLFMPQGSRSIKELKGNYVADIVEHAHKLSGKKIVLAGDSYASLLALTGAHQWQQRSHISEYLVGAILFSPYMYEYIPPLGLDPVFMPIASSTNIPIVIYQTKDSGNIGQFAQLLENLQKNGSPVYTKIIPGLMSLFYNELPTEDMLEQIHLLPSNIVKMLSVLEKHDVPERVVSLNILDNNKSGVDIKLKAFKADAKPLSIELEDVYGNNVVKNDFSNKVTLINFWATWCPPCVEEIPSLNRLKKSMQGLPFELISINYAEDKAEILAFMDKVNVEFPVLLDKNGFFSKQWNVITFPSTFIIDPDGQIKYGVNAAIEWDSPETIEKIKLLMKQK